MSSFRSWIKLLIDHCLAYQPLLIFEKRALIIGDQGRLSLVEEKASYLDEAEPCSEQKKKLLPASIYLCSHSCGKKLTCPAGDAEITHCFRRWCSLWNQSPLCMESLKLYRVFMLGPFRKHSLSHACTTQE